jgi:hypothetical protein
MANSHLLFPRWSNHLVRAILGGVGLLAGLLLVFAFSYFRSPLFTRQNDPLEQPVEFDHRHHVRDHGIDCRFCHTTVEKAAMAGYPPTEVCGSCHGQVWNKSPYLASIRTSLFTGKPLEWVRVNDLRDYVYFNHSIHVNKGVGCVTCHGRVDEMAAVHKFPPMNMGWCLDCHRDPTPNLRPREAITSMTWKAPGDDPRKVGEEVAKKNHVHTRTACSTCHR